MLMTDMPRRTLIQTAVVLTGLIAVAPAVQAQARNHATLAMVAEPQTLDPMASTADRVGRLYKLNEERACRCGSFQATCSGG